MAGKQAPRKNCHTDLGQTRQLPPSKTPHPSTASASPDMSPERSDGVPGVTGPAAANHPAPPLPSPIPHPRCTLPPWLPAATTSPEDPHAPSPPSMQHRNTARSQARPLPAATMSHKPDPVQHEFKNQGLYRAALCDPRHRDGRYPDAARVLVRSFNASVAHVGNHGKTACRSPDSVLCQRRADIDERRSRLVHVAAGDGRPQSEESFRCECGLCFGDIAREH